MSVEVEPVDKHAGDHPLFGHTRVSVTTTTQHGEAVLTMDGLGLVEKRDG